MTFSEQLEFTNRTNRFMNHCGIRMTELREGLCRAELTVEDFCKNTGETIHGGLLYTMADCAVSAYGRAVYGACVTLSGEFHYLSNVTGGVLMAEVRPVKQGGTVLVMRAEVRAGDKLLADGTFTCYRR